MKALLQRVSSARVKVGDHVYAEIGHGLLVLLCVEIGDGLEETEFLVRKTANIRIFEDDNGKMNFTVRNVNGRILVISQFTLCADATRGNRPGFKRAAQPEIAKSLYIRFCNGLKSLGLDVETGKFAAKMCVQSANDGPVTIWLDTKGTRLT